MSRMVFRGGRTFKSCAHLGDHPDGSLKDEPLVMRIAGPAVIITMLLLSVDILIREAATADATNARHAMAYLNLSFDVPSR
jgi:hypothetical protein